MNQKVFNLQNRVNHLRDVGWTWADLGRESGIEQSYLRKFAGGQIPDPSLTRFETMTKLVRKLERRQ